MPKLLHIQSSPNLTTSHTRTLADKFVATWVASHENVEVETLDLVLDPLPHYGPDALAANFVPPDERTPGMIEALEISDRLVTQLESADIVLIGSALINFTITTQLKGWFDYVTVAGRTFEFAAPGQSRGLLFGKKVFVIEARGGDYGSPPMTAFDFQEPLLRMLLMFLGMFDVSFIRAEGVRQFPEKESDIVARAEYVIERLAS